MEYLINPMLVCACIVLFGMALEKPIERFLNIAIRTYYSLKG
ncbi:hypothetical protein [Dyadobacter fanqingshengii]|nr:hypothetical protein [Dyadobacter fanqingshengii]